MEDIIREYNNYTTYMVEDMVKEYKHYKVFPIIYSIKDKLCKYNNDRDICQLCFINKVYNQFEGGWYHDDDMPDESEFEPLNKLMIGLLNPELKDVPPHYYMLCRNCVYLYSEKDVIDLIQDILNNSYHYNDGNFDMYLELFKEYITNPYEKLLMEYFSYNMGTHYFYHENCEHFIKCSNNCDKEGVLCTKILDIIDHISDLYYCNFLIKCPIKYIPHLIKRGIDINHLNEKGLTTFDELMYGFVNHEEYYINDYYEKRIKTLIENGANVNAGKPLREITGIQYENRPNKISRIKYLKELGVNFDNKCISYCQSQNQSEKCTFHKMLYDTRLGKLLISMTD
jgi:hypothetical protein